MLYWRGAIKMPIKRPTSVEVAWDRSANTRVRGMRWAINSPTSLPYAME